MLANRKEEYIKFIRGSDLLSSIPDSLDATKQSSYFQHFKKSAGNQTVIHISATQTITSGFFPLA